MDPEDGAGRRRRARKSDYPALAEAWRPVLQVREPPVKQFLEARVARLSAAPLPGHLSDSDCSRGSGNRVLVKWKRNGNRRSRGSRGSANESE